jgi:tRNA(fMet)-specific endonuclease VapC
MRLSRSRSRAKVRAVIWMELPRHFPGALAPSNRPQHVRLWAITKAGLVYGARHSKRVNEKLQLVTAFCTPYQCLPFDNLCAEHHGLIRTDLVGPGEHVPPIDLVIAATARAHDLTLVTHNRRGFAPIIVLTLEDGEAE